MLNKILQYISFIFIVLAILIFSVTWIQKGKFSDIYKIVRDSVTEIENIEKEYVGKYIVDQICLINPIL